MTGYKARVLDTLWTTLATFLGQLLHGLRSAFQRVARVYDIEDARHTRQLRTQRCTDNTEKGLMTNIGQ